MVNVVISTRVSAQCLGRILSFYSTQGKSPISRGELLRWVCEDFVSVLAELNQLPNLSSIEAIELFNKHGMKPRFTGTGSGLAHALASELTPSPATKEMINKALQTWREEKGDVQEKKESASENQECASENKNQEKEGD